MEGGQEVKWPHPSLWSWRLKDQAGSHFPPPHGDRRRERQHSHLRSVWRSLSCFVPHSPRSTDPLAVTCPAPPVLWDGGLMAVFPPPPRPLPGPQLPAGPAPRIRAPYRLLSLSAGCEVPCFPSWLVCKPPSDISSDAAFPEGVCPDPELRIHVKTLLKKRLSRQRLLDQKGAPTPTSFLSDTELYGRKACPPEPQPPARGLGVCPSRWVSLAAGEITIQR